PDHLAGPQRPREGQVRPLAGQPRPLAAELQAVVADQRARQQARLAEDLEAVADAPDETAPGGELAHPFHHGREARDRAGAQVVAVAEAPGQHHAVDAVQVRLLVPQVAQLGAQDVLDHVAAVAVRPGAREDHDSEPHPRASASAPGTTSKEKSSITWLA